MKKKILMTHTINKEYSDLFFSDCDLELVKDPEDLKSKISSADALITLLSDKVDQNLLNLGRRLKVVGNYAVGIDNIDLEYCHQKKIAVVHTPKVLTRSTAELALTLLLCASRRTFEGESLCREGQFKGWRPDLLLGQELKGKKAVIVGAGRIGTETGKLFKAIGMNVSTIKRSDSTKKITSLLQKADVLSLHIPSTKDNFHWLDQFRIGLLPRNCIVINTARGDLIDERALITALEEKRIFAAGLDVFENEPEIPERLRVLKNVTLLPHLGSATSEARGEMAKILFEGVKKVLSGNRPWNQVKMTKDPV